LAGKVKRHVFLSPSFLPDFIKFDATNTWEENQNFVEKSGKLKQAKTALRSSGAGALFPVTHV
jgi:hypothetical protein